MAGDRRKARPFAAVMHALADVREARADFVETKTMKMLNRPLASTGQLSYTAPDTLERNTVSPTPEKLRVAGNILTIVGDSGTRTLNLADYPQIGGFVETLRATLAGDSTTLEKYFQVQFKGDAAGWSLLLLPRDKDVASMISWVMLSGHDGVLTRVESSEPNGDHSETVITPVSTQPAGAVHP